jgi:hypothetical protein
MCLIVLHSYVEVPRGQILDIQIFLILVTDNVYRQSSTYQTKQSG